MRQRSWLVMGLATLAVAQSVLLALYAGGVLGRHDAAVIIETATPGETLLLNGEPVATPYHLEVVDGITSLRLGTSPAGTPTRNAGAR